MPCMFPLFFPKRFGLSAVKACGFGVWREFPAGLSWGLLLGKLRVGLAVKIKGSAAGILRLQKELCEL